MRTRSPFRPFYSFGRLQELLSFAEEAEDSDSDASGDEGGPAENSDDDAGPDEARPSKSLSADNIVRLVGSLKVCECPPKTPTPPSSSELVAPVMIRSFCET